MYTCGEVAERYKVKVITVWEWIRQQKLGAIKIGKEYRVSEEDLIAFENSRKTTLAKQRMSQHQFDRKEMRRVEEVDELIKKLAIHIGQIISSGKECEGEVA